MASTVGVFDFEMSNLHGPSVIAVRDRLCAGCLSDGEIDANIRLLKDDLDAVAKRMKAALRRMPDDLFLDPVDAPRS